MLEKYSVDIVSHINYGIKADAVEVARACRHFGTYVELNGKRISMTDKELELIAAEGTEFICDSDAHSVERVGDFSVPIAAIERWEFLTRKLPIGKDFRGFGVARKRGFIRINSFYRGGKSGQSGS